MIRPHTYRSRLVPAFLILIVAVAAHVPADSPADSPAASPALTVRPSLELGFVDVPHHTLQFGENTDQFDYVTQGGQEILFPFQRLRIDVGIG
ncbi:MAG: hypothetical protein R6U25_01795, partial [Alkalispirochaeta sp.]